LAVSAIFSGTFSEIFSAAEEEEGDAAEIGAVRI